MKLVNTNPPNNIRELCEGYFSLKDFKPIFTYGDTIYNPHCQVLDPSIEAHETVHSIRQGDKPEEWWDRYFKDKDFRFNEELLAYRTQYDFCKRTLKDRNMLARQLHNLATILSSSLYGGIISYTKAKDLIKK